MIRAIMTCLVFFSAYAIAEVPKVDGLAESLIKLRGEVETLDAEVVALREDSRLEIQTLKVQQGEMAASIEAEKLKRDQLSSQISELKGQLSKKGFEDTQMKQTVIDGILGLQEYVASSIPFQKSKREKELAELKDQVERDQITSVKASIRLWSFVEDELRSATENSVFRQTVKIGESEQLVEVAKLGSLFLFYKTNEGNYGTAVSGNDGWTFQPLTDSKQEAQVVTLFESLKKQIRTGQFFLPNQLNGRL